MWSGNAELSGRVPAKLAEMHVPLAKRRRNPAHTYAGAIGNPAACIDFYIGGQEAKRILDRGAGPAGLLRNLRWWADRLRVLVIWSKAPTCAAL